MNMVVIQRCAEPRVLLEIVNSVEANQLQARVVGVAVGDTVTVLDAVRRQQKVRLTGIDVPEKAQAFGNRSKNAFSDFAFGKEVTIETHKMERYGRSAGKVFEDGQDCNLRQIELGFTWHYKQFEKNSLLKTACATPIPNTLQG